MQVLKDCEKSSSFMDWSSQKVMTGDPPVEVTQRSLLRDLLISPGKQKDITVEIVVETVS
jgi:hypothetical protein